jgi:hypothetical protein
VVTVLVRDEQQIDFGTHNRRIVELQASPGGKPCHVSERIDEDALLPSQQKRRLAVPADERQWSSR